MLDKDEACRGGRSLTVVTVVLGKLQLQNVFTTLEASADKDASLLLIDLVVEVKVVLALVGLLEVLLPFAVLVVRGNRFIRAEAQKDFASGY